MVNYVTPDPSKTSPGTDQDDYFSILSNPPQLDWSQVSLNGGAGTDILDIQTTDEIDLRKFATFSGIEEIKFGTYGGTVSLTSQQLAGINSIRGGTYQSVINLAGGALQAFDLRGKSLTGNYIIRESDIPSSPLYSDIIINDKSQVLTDTNVLVQMFVRSGIRVHLIGASFTAEERQRLSYNGSVSFIWDDSDSINNAAPVTSGLDGDQVKVQNKDWVYVDAGLNASVSDDVSIRKISVSVVNANGNDWIDFDYFSSVELREGLVEGATLRDKTNAYSAVMGNLYHVTNSSFDIMFNGDATPDFINRVVRALIYMNDGAAAQVQRQIKITVFDGADKAIASTTTVTHTAVLTAPATGGTIIGTAESNLIKGSSASDTIKAGAGNDTIYGSAGKDVLMAGTGRDVFVFNTKPSSKNVDKILDFSTSYDKIWLENAVFTKVGKYGSVTKPAGLSSGAFYIGAAAHDASDRIIYNKTTGALYYDPDGTGQAAKVQLAALKAGLGLSYKHFFVI